MDGILIIKRTRLLAKNIPVVCLPFVLNKNASKAISEAEYALNPERLNIDRGALGSECHARSGLGGFSDFPTQRHAPRLLLPQPRFAASRIGTKVTQYIEQMPCC